MNLDSLVRRGYPVWAPTPDSGQLDPWHIADVPLVGTFETPRGTVLFSAIEEVDSSPSLWAYRPLSEDEATHLVGRTFESVPAMIVVVESLFAGHEVVVVRAKDFRVENWGRVWVEDGLVPAATEFLQSVIRQLESELPAHMRGAVATVTEAADEQLDRAAGGSGGEPEVRRLRMDAESAAVDRIEELASASH